MKNDKVIVCDLPSLAEGETKQRIQVFPGPDEYVHPKSGPFTLTKEHLEEFAADINARAIPSDRDHAFYKGMSAPAAGWLVQGSAEVSDGGVTAEVEWTPKAAQEVRDREYRFISPEFSFNKAEPNGAKVAEPTLHAVTLTNRPFFKMMAPVAAEDLSLEDELMVAEEFGEQVAETLLKISADAAAEVIAAAATTGRRGAFADPGYRKDGRQRYALDSADAVQAAWRQIGHGSIAKAYTAEQMSRMKARIKRAAKKFGITIGADSTAGGNMDLTAIAESLGIAADASEEDVLEAAQKVAAENTELKSKLDKAPDDSQMKLLLASAAKGERAASELAEMKRDATITKAIDDLVIPASAKETYEGFWAIDPEGTAKLLAEMKPMLRKEPLGTDATVVPVMGADGKPLAAQAGNGDSTLTADTSPVMIDGVPTPVDEDKAKIHAAASDLLAKRGVSKDDDEYADKYVAACMEVAPIVGVSL